MSDSEFTVAQRTQEKFEFYLISLVFTLLALSIQTAKFGQSTVADLFELLGWFTLFVSGITGLWRMEYIPLERAKRGYKDDLNSKINTIKEYKLKGQTKAYIVESESVMQLDELLEKHKSGIAILDPLIAKLEKQGMWKYTVHRSCLAVGVLLILIARGFPPAFALIEKIF